MNVVLLSAISFLAGMTTTALIYLWGGVAKRRKVKIKREKFFSSFRWAIATRLNKRSNTCWSSLVDWSEIGTERPWSFRISDFKQMKSCTNDRTSLGSCYCGKLREENETKEKP